MYIVVFNINSRDPEFYTTSYGFIEKFYDEETAKSKAEEWIDGKDYRNFIVLKEA